MILGPDTKLEGKYVGFGYISNPSIYSLKDNPDSIQDIISLYKNLGFDLLSKYTKFYNKFTTTGQSIFGEASTFYYKIKLKDMITDHVFTKFNKPKLYTPRNYHANDIYFKNNIELRQAAFLLNKTYAYYGNKFSDILAIDIDHPDSLQILLKLKQLKFPNAKEILIEQSPLNKIHVYYKLDKCYSQEELQQIEKEFQQDLGFKIEIRSSKAFRLPGSFAYQPGQLIYNCFVPYPNDLSWVYNSKQIIEKLKDTEKISFQSKLQIEPEPIKQIKEPVKIKYSLRYRNPKSTALKTFGPHQRNNSLMKIIPIHLWQKFTLEQSLDYTLNNLDLGSNLKLTNLDLYKKDYAYKWDYLQKNFKPKIKEYTQWFSNLDLINQHSELSFKNLKKLITPFVLHEYKSHQNQWIEDYSKLITAILGQIIYDIQNPKINHLNMPKDKFQTKFGKGIQICRKTLDLIKLEMGIHRNIYRMYRKLGTSIYSPFKFISHSYAKEGYSYCKQLTIGSLILDGKKHISDLINILRSYLNLFQSNKETEKTILPICGLYKESKKIGLDKSLDLTYTLSSA